MGQASLTVATGVLAGCQVCRVLAINPAAFRVFLLTLVGTGRSCKITLTGRAMLKLAVDIFQQSALNQDLEHVSSTACISWESEQPRFVSFVLDRHSNIDCIAVHAGKRAGIKPTKDDEYSFIHGHPYVLEQTPNGVPFALSPDTFCEVCSHSVHQCHS